MAATPSFATFLDQSAAIVAASQPMQVRGRLTRVAGLVTSSVADLPRAPEEPAPEKPPPAQPVQPTRNAGEPVAVIGANFNHMDVAS